MTYDSKEPSYATTKTREIIDHTSKLHLVTTNFTSPLSALAYCPISVRADTPSENRMSSNTSVYFFFVKGQLYVMFITPQLFHITLNVLNPFTQHLHSFQNSSLIPCHKTSHFPTPLILLSSHYFFLQHERLPCCHYAICMWQIGHVPFTTLYHTPAVFPFIAGMPAMASPSIPHSLTPRRILKYPSYKSCPTWQ